MVMLRGCPRKTREILQGTDYLKINSLHKKYSYLKYYLDVLYVVIDLNALGQLYPRFLYNTELIKI